MVRQDRAKWEIQEKIQENGKVWETSATEEARHVENKVTSHTLRGKAYIRNVG